MAKPLITPKGIERKARAIIRLAETLERALNYRNKNDDWYIGAKVEDIHKASSLKTVRRRHFGERKEKLSLVSGKARHIYRVKTEDR